MSRVVSRRVAVRLAPQQGDGRSDNLPHQRHAGDTFASHGSRLNCSSSDGELRSPDDARRSQAVIMKRSLLVGTMLSTMVLLQPSLAPARDDGNIRLAQNPPAAAAPENERDKQKQRPGGPQRQEQKQQPPQGGPPPGGPPAQQRVQQPPAQPPAQPKPPQQAQPAAPHPPQPPTAAQPPQRPTAQQPAPPPAAQQQQAQPPASAQPPGQRPAPTAQDQQQRQDQRQQRPGQPPAPTAQQPTPPQPPTAAQPPQRPTVQQPAPPAPTQQAQPPASTQPPGQRPSPTAQQPATPQQQQAQPPASAQQPGQRPAPTAQQPIQTPPGAQQLPVPGAPQQAARPAPTTPPAPSALQTLQPQAPAAGQGQAAAPAFNRTGRIDDVRRERREVREGDRNIIQEAGRVIIQEAGRAIIRHNEIERFRADARDVRVERRGNETVTVVERPDGVRIVTVTDEYGRLVRRSRRGPDGREFVLIDNRYRGPAVVGNYYVDLPPPVIRIPRERYIVEAERASREDIYAALMAPPVERIDRRYTLDEIRYSPRLLERMPRVDLDTVNFDSGSWQLTPDQIGRLQVIADGIKQALAQNPGEVFLIQGHTDAVGSDVDNLSLSDRRAESVALALSEQFQVPAENLTTQGYGEQYLKVQTDGPERQNRRVTVQRITPLLGSEGQPGQPG